MNERNKSKVATLILLILLTSIVLPSRLSIAGNDPDSDSIRVGIEHNPPMAFMDKNGKPSGFFPEILNTIASEEKWNLSYIPDSFSQLMQKLEQGEIDLLLGVAYSEDRASQFDFTQQALILSWAYLYRVEGSSVETILDLENRTMAVVGDDIYYHLFRAMLKKFNIAVEFVEVGSFTDVFQILHRNEVDTGLVSRLSALEQESDYDIERTSIVCCPRELRFVATKGKHQEILSILDRHIVEMMKDKESIYFQAMNKWVMDKESQPLPTWIIWIVVALLFVILHLIFVTFYTRKWLRIRTAKLEQTIRWMRMLSSCNHAMLKSTDESCLLERVTRNVVEIGGYKLCWVGFAEENADKTIRPVACAGFDDEYIDSLSFSWGDEDSGRGPIGKAIRTGQSVAFNDVASNPDFALWYEEASKRGYASVAAFPLLDNGRKFGALSIYSSEKDCFREAEMKVLEEMTCDLAYGISSLRVKEKQAISTAQLQTSEKQFSNAFEFAPIGMALVGTDGRFLDVNSVFCEMLEYPKEEVLTMSFSDITHPDDLKADQNLVRQMLEGQIETFKIKKRYIHKQGREIWAFLSVSMVHDDDRQPLYFISQIEDINEQVKLKKKMRATLSSLEAILASTPLPVITFDMRGNVTGWNPAAEKLFGWSESEVLGKVAPMLTSENLAITGETLGLILQGEMLKMEDVTIVRRDGSFVSCDIAFGTLSGTEQETIGAVSIFSDITERKNTDAELAKHREHLEELVKERTEEINQFFVLSLDMLCIANKEAHFTKLNKAWEDTLGYSQGELMNRTFLDFVHPDDMESTRSTAAKLFEHKSVRGFINRFRHKDGSYRWLEWAFASDGRLIYAVAHDITDHQKYEDTLRDAKLAAEDANRSKSSFLSNMSHEIRTPLNSILGYAQLMKRDSNIPKVYKEYVSLISNSGDHLLELINSILDMSKIEAGQIKLEPQNMDFYGMLKDIESMFGVQAGEKGISMEVNIRSDVPRNLNADAGKIRQVLMNLLSNAVKFTDKGGIVVKAQRDKNATEEHVGVIAVEVQDTGKGIAADELDGVFAAFEQTKSGVNSLSGTGLGMAISRQYARLMGGDLTIESREGVGSVFKFTFTYRPGEVTEVVTVKENRQVRHLAENSMGFKILIVDDIKSNRDVLSLLLESVGFQTLEAGDGKEAIHDFEEWRPDVILMDRRMPKMEGFEAISRIRELPGGADVKMIMITASALEENRVEAIAAGADGFIRKPFRDCEIFSELKKHLDLEYVYEVDQEKAIGSQKLPVFSESKQIALLPAPLIAVLLDAAESGDIQRLRELLETEVKELFPDMAEAFRHLADNYNYTRIIELLTMGGRNDGSKKEKSADHDY